MIGEHDVLAALNDLIGIRHVMGARDTAHVTFGFWLFLGASGKIRLLFRESGGSVRNLATDDVTDAGGHGKNRT